MGTPSVILSLPLLQVGPNNSSNGPRCSEEGQEVGRQHQRPSCPRHQVGQVHPRLQVDPQGHVLGQGPSPPPFRARVLRHALPHPGPPLPGLERRARNRGRSPSASVSSRSRTPVTRTSSRSRPSKLLDANLWKEGEGTHLDSRADRKERYFQGRTTLL